MALSFLTSYGSFKSIYIKNNNYFNNVNQRIGYVSFLKKASLRTFFVAFFISLLTKIYQLILSFIILKKLPSNVVIPAELSPFADNRFSSCVIFIILASLGWGIYAVFIFSLGLFIKKNSIYLVLGAIVGTLLILIPGMFSRILTYGMYILLLPTLIAPGQMTFGILGGKHPNVYIGFLLSASIYLIFSLFLMYWWMVYKQKKG
ncbi:hypothetical protein HU830_02010 [Lactobacillus sp. DCY120]|uniref:Uncharacterized protein n=1 Tax=Bombilactobacillus apium TaxID=2675299 RepID=A0A850R540_9LACO|nr:hypothetical protein [Bombilactobacillus apium]